MSSLEIEVMLNSVTIFIVAAILSFTKLKLDKAERDIEWLKEILESWRKG